MTAVNTGTTTVHPPTTVTAKPNNDNTVASNSPTEIPADKCNSPTDNDSNATGTAACNSVGTGSTGNTVMVGNIETPARASVLYMARVCTDASAIPDANIQS